MKTDPYSELYETLRAAGGEASRSGALHYRLATVLAVSPLSLDVCGTTQEAARFYIADRLLQGHQELVALRGGAGGFSANGGTHSVQIDAGTLSISDVTMAQQEPVLKAGDLVLLLTDDDQTFILIDKVVHL